MAHIKDDFDIRECTLCVIFQDKKKYPEILSAEDAEVWDVHNRLKVQIASRNSSSYTYTASGPFECVEEIMSEVANYFTAYEIDCEKAELEDRDDAAREAYELSCADMYEPEYELFS